MHLLHTYIYIYNKGVSSIWEEMFAISKLFFQIYDTPYAYKYIYIYIHVYGKCWNVIWTMTFSWKKTKLAFVLYLKVAYVHLLSQYENYAWNINGQPTADVYPSICLPCVRRSPYKKKSNGDLSVTVTVANSYRNSRYLCININVFNILCCITLV